MNPVTRLLERAVDAFNRAPLWRGHSKVWDQTMTAATFERWLYLRLHRLGRMGREERATLMKIVQPGMTVLDIGGNLGLYTVLLSRLVGPAGRVITFEPDPDLFATLQRNCVLNGCANVEAHNLAVGSSHGRLLLQKLVFNAGDNHLAEGGSRLFRHAVETEVVALDEFLPGLRPDLVKIDVQGWEFEVLKGMDAMLRAHPGTDIYLELWPQGLRRASCSTEAVVHWLRDRGFKLYGAHDLKPLDDSALSTLSRELTGLKHADLIASRRN
jgi:FkbM family methyltransferase